MPPIGAIHPKSEYILGVDFARMGQDSSVFIILEKPFGEEIIYVVYIEEMKHRHLNEAVGKVKFLDAKFHFHKIYLDETGLGSGPTDMLREHFGGFKVQGVYFTIKSKQDLYSNLKRMMEQKQLKIPNYRKLLFQLADLRYEVTSSGNLKIHHSERGHDDFPDALALACFHYTVKSKSEYHLF